MECKICNKELKNFLGLTTHIRYSHKDLSVKEYYDLFFKKENEEKCGNPNCNNLNSFICISNGYQKHCSGRCKMLDPKVQEKMKKTLIKNHGVEHALKSKKILKSMELNNLKKYGSKNIQQVSKFKEKTKNTCLIKYGVFHSILTEKSIQNNPANKKGKFVSIETREKLRKSNSGLKRSNEFKEKRRLYMLNGGASYVGSFVKNPSIPQIKLFEIVKDIFSTAILNYSLKEINRVLDIAIPQLKICIEYDGTYWHQDKKDDNYRQTQIENLGWQFIRYVDKIPTKEQIIKDMNRFLFCERKDSQCKLS